MSKFTELKINPDCCVEPNLERQGTGCDYDGADSYGIYECLSCNARWELHPLWGPKPFIRRESLAKANEAKETE